MNINGKRQGLVIKCLHVNTKNNHYTYFHVHHKYLSSLRFCLLNQRMLFISERCECITVQGLRKSNENSDEIYLTNGAYTAIYTCSIIHWCPLASVLLLGANQNIFIIWYVHVRDCEWCMKGNNVSYCTVEILRDLQLIEPCNDNVCELLHFFVCFGATELEQLN